MKKIQIIRFIAIAFVLIIISVAAFKLLGYFKETRAASNEFEDLSEVFHNAALPEKDIAPVSTEGMTEQEAAEAVEQQQIYIQRLMIDSLTALYEQNSDTFGWVTVEGTRIDYPVMHTPEQPEKYLELNYAQGASNSGTPFLDYRCTSDSDSMIIYGHNIKTGSMFHDLLSYQTAGYLDEHGLVTLTTSTAVRTYTIVSAFPSVANTDENDFAWWDYINFSGEAMFNDYVSKVRSHSLYEVEFDAVYGKTNFLTLATCSYHANAGRMVVIAIEVK